MSSEDEKTSHEHDADEEKIALKGLHAAEDHDEEHVEHIDERWLVSYADMMTLLFGLFVLLYAIQDPEQIKKMQQSIEQQFSDNKEVSASPAIASKTPPSVSPEDYNKMMLEKTFIEDNLRVAQNRIQELEDQAKQTEKLLLENKELTTKIQKSETSKRQIANVDDEKLKKTIDETSSLKRKIVEKDKKLADLEKQVHALQNDKKNFLAVVISWSTQDHDIDLYVKDPTGKVFNFKNRKFANHPGAFLLDTRKGPGTEAWQSDELFPGIYEIRIEFYNQYDNLSPAFVRGTVFSAKGTFEIKEEKMDFAQKKPRIIKIEVTKDSAIHILP